MGKIEEFLEKRDRVTEKIMNYQSFYNWLDGKIIESRRALEEEIRFAGVERREFDIGTGIRYNLFLDAAESVPWFIRELELRRVKLERDYGVMKGD